MTNLTISLNSLGWLAVLEAAFRSFGSPRGRRRRRLNNLEAKQRNPKIADAAEEAMELGLIRDRARKQRFAVLEGTHVQAVEPGRPAGVEPGSDPDPYLEALTA